MRPLAPALVAAVLGLTLLGAAGPAAAHGDEVVLEVVEATPSDEGSAVTYQVALTYENDGDGINGATVTATAFLAGGDPAAPQALTGTGTDGLYEGTIAFSAPGQWRVQFDAADPEAQAQASATYRVPAPAPPTTSAAPAITLPPPTSVAVEPTLTEDDTETGGDDPPVGLFAGLAVAGLVFVGAAVYAVRRRRTARPALQP
ncbi:MAG: FixH family protein [Acidimicrobiales bacterium]